MEKKSKYYKYCKYKIKYLNLKKKTLQKGGNDIFILNGPTSLYYYPNIKGKKILLLGEYHINEDRCDKQVSKVFNPNEEYIMDPLSLIMHLAKMNEKTNNCLDFFLEDGYYTKNHIIDSSKIPKSDSNSYNVTTQINLIRSALYLTDCGPIKGKIKNKNKNIVKNKLKKCPNGFRYHYFDIMHYQLDDKNKYHDNVFITLLRYYDLFENYIINSSNINFTDKKTAFNYTFSIYIYLIGFKKLKKEYNLGKKYYKDILKYVVDNGYLQEKCNCHPDCKIIYEIMSIRQTEEIANKIYKQIKNIDNKYFTSKELINYWKYKIEIAIYDNTITTNSKDQIEKIYDSLNIYDSFVMIMRMAYTDTYTIARMFRKFTPKRKIKNCEGKKSLQNIIHYSGGAHTESIRNFIEWKFKISPEISINPDYNKSNYDILTINQCLYIPKFNPFDLKMPWN